MATRTAREIKKGLTKKGFVAVQRDHTYLFFSVAGRKSGVHTKISHGNKEYGDNIKADVANKRLVSITDWRSPKEMK